MTFIGKNWGTSVEERRLSFPCDQIIPTPDAMLYRGVTVNAAPRTVFRWLCQLRAAPYSYDWIDNGGQKSPPSLTAGLDKVAIGQDVMRIFSVAAFAEPHKVINRPVPIRTAYDVARAFLTLRI